MSQIAGISTASEMRATTPATSVSVVRPMSGAPSSVDSTPDPVMCSALKPTCSASRADSVVLVIAPGILIVFAVLSANVFGNALRDALDPNLR